MTTRTHRRAAPFSGATRLGRHAAAIVPLVGVFAFGMGASAQDELILPPSAEVSAPAGPTDEFTGDLDGGRNDSRTDDRNGNRGDAAAAKPADDIADRTPEAGAAAGEPAGRPGEAHLASPDVPLPMEEVIVVNESEWRLPDLGSAWRAAQAEAPETGRISVAWLPLYDPANADPVTDMFDRNSELHRVGMIELVRLRFGGRPKD